MAACCDSVLEAALEMAVSARTPGEVWPLPFHWHEDPADTKWPPAEPSPIIAMMKERQARRDAKKAD